MDGTTGTRGLAVLRATEVVKRQDRLPPEGARHIEEQEFVYGRDIYLLL